MRKIKPYYEHSVQCLTDYDCPVRVVNTLIRRRLRKIKDVERYVEKYQSLSRLPQMGGTNHALVMDAINAFRHGKDGWVDCYIDGGVVCTKEGIPIEGKITRANLHTGEVEKYVTDSRGIVIASATEICREIVKYPPPLVFVKTVHEWYED